MIVVTGYGVKAPGAPDANRYRQVLEQGVCALTVKEGAGPLETDLVCGEVEGDFIHIEQKSYKYYPRVARLALAAAVEAVESAALGGALAGKRVAVVTGTSCGGLIDIEKGAAFSTAGIYRKFPMLSAGMGSYHSVSSAITSHFGLHGMTLTLSTGCSASTDAIFLGKMLLESGQADVCLVGGVDAPITPYAVYSFAKLKGIQVGVEKEQIGNPFSEETEGFVMSEGAGILVLEREENARDRQAPVYGVLDGIATNNDGVSIYESDPEGVWMRDALAEALGGRRPAYINSQALGLATNDQVERKVYKQLFGGAVPITSIKGMIGHPFGAVGVLQTISALISLREGFIPPTIRSSGKGFEDLPIVFETTYRPVHSVAVTTHGYGGNNTCLLVSQYT